MLSGRIAPTNLGSHADVPGSKTPPHAGCCREAPIARPCRCRVGPIAAKNFSRSPAPQTIHTRAHSTSMVRRLGGGKSRVAGARIRPRLRERSPTPFAYPPSLPETTLHRTWMRSKSPRCRAHRCGSGRTRPSAARRSCRRRSRRARRIVPPSRSPQSSVRQNRH